MQAESAADESAAPDDEIPHRRILPPSSWAARMRVPRNRATGHNTYTLGFSNADWGFVSFDEGRGMGPLSVSAVVRTEADPTAICERSPFGNTLYVATYDGANGIAVIEEWRLDVDVGDKIFAGERTVRSSEEQREPFARRREVFRSRSDEVFPPILDMRADSKNDRLWILTRPVGGKRIERLRLATEVKSPSDLELMASAATVEDIDEVSRLVCGLYEDGRFVVMGVTAGSHSVALAPGEAMPDPSILLFADDDWDGVVDERIVTTTSEYRRRYPPGTGWDHSYSHPPQGR